MAIPSPIHRFVPFQYSEDVLSSRYEHLTAHSRTWIRTDDRLACFSLEQGNILWSVTCPLTDDPSPKGDRPFTMLGRTSLWVGEDRRVIVALGHEGPGVIARGFDAATGRELWARPFIGPGAASGSPTEPESVENALLAPIDEALVLAIVGSPLADAPVPGAQLWRLDPLTGADLGDFRTDAELSQTTLFPGSLVVNDDEIGEMDWSTGTLRRVAGPFDNTPSSPVETETGLLTSFCSGRGAVTVLRIEPGTGEILTSATWPYKGVKSTEVREHDGTVALHINSQILVLLNDKLKPCWEARAKPYIYDMAALPGGPILVGTSGNGGYLYAFDRATGEQLLHAKPPRGGGVDALWRIPGPDLFAARFDPGIIIVDARTLEHHHVQLRGNPQIVGVDGRRIAAFASQPRHQGLHIIDVSSD